MTVTLLQTARTASRKLSAVLALTAAFGVGAAYVGAPALADRRDAKDDATYSIKRVYKAGQTDRYRISLKMNMDLPGTPLDIVETMFMKETTREAKDDGSATVAFDFESVAVTANGMDMDMTAMMPKIITTLDKNGKTDVKLEGGSQEVTAQMGDQVKQFTNAAAALAPKKPVKVGDSWDLDAANFGAPGQNVKGKATLVSVDTVKGVKIGRIKSVINITGAMDLAMHSESITLVDFTTGKALSLTSKSDGDIAGGKMSMEMTMKMLGPDDKSDVKAAVKTDSSVKKP